MARGREKARRVAMPVTLAIYDVAGRRVRELAGGTWTAGDHDVVWDGRDARGRASASGVYFARLVTPERTETRSLVLVR